MVTAAGLVGAATGYQNAEGMLTFALKATSHLAAWLIWQSMRVSVLEDLEVPARSQ